MNDSISHLRRLLAAANDHGSGFEALGPVIEEWFAWSASLVAEDHDLVSLEVSWSSGRHELDTGIENPAPESIINEANTWFAVTALRYGPQGRPAVAEHGVEMWFPEDQDLLALLQHDAWDTGNLLGFRLSGRAGSESRLVTNSGGGVRYSAGMRRQSTGTHQLGCTRKS